MLFNKTAIPSCMHNLHIQPINWQASPKASTADTSTSNSIPKSSRHPRTVSQQLLTNSLFLQRYSAELLVEQPFEKHPASLIFYCSRRCGPISLMRHLRDCRHCRKLFRTQALSHEMQIFQLVSQPLYGAPAHEAHRRELLISNARSRRGGDFINYLSECFGQHVMLGCWPADARCGCLGQTLVLEVAGPKEQPTW